MGDSGEDAGRGDDDDGGGAVGILSTGGVIATALACAQHAQLVAVFAARGQGVAGIAPLVDRLVESVDALMRYASTDDATLQRRRAAPADAALRVRYARCGASAIFQFVVGGRSCGALVVEREPDADMLLGALCELPADLVYLGELREPEPPL